MWVGVHEHGVPPVVKQRSEDLEVRFGVAGDVPLGEGLRTSLNGQQLLTNDLVTCEWLLDLQIVNETHFSWRKRTTIIL